MSTRFFPIALALLLLAGCDCERCCEPCPLPSKPAEPLRGSISGDVRHVGAPFVPRKMAPPQGAPVGIPNPIPDLQLVVNAKNSGIHGAIVRLMDVDDPTPPPSTLPIFDMKGYMFHPRVLIVPPGNIVNFVNPGGATHNLHSTSLDFENHVFNFSFKGEIQFIRGQNFKHPEIIKVDSDFYQWMTCYIVVHDPRYAAVTDENGHFQIKNLRPGKYKLNVYQELCGEKSVDIQVLAGKSSRVDVNLKSSNR